MPDNEMSFASALREGAEPKTEEFGFANALRSPLPGVRQPRETSEAEILEQTRGLGYEPGRYYGVEGAGQERPVGTYQAPTDRTFMQKVTGSDMRTPETEALPELSRMGLYGTEEEHLESFSNYARAVGFAVKKFFSSGDAEVLKQFQNAIPGTTWEPDAQGNIIVTLGDGRKAVLNRSGVSQSDIDRLVNEAVKFAPAGAPKTAAGRIGAAAGIATAGEAISEEFEPGQIALETAFAGAGEGLGRLATEAIPAAFRSGRLRMTFASLAKRDEAMANQIAEWAQKNAPGAMDQAVGERAAAAMRTQFSEMGGRAQEAYEAAVAPIYRSNPKVNTTDLRPVFADILRRYEGQAPERSWLMQRMKRVFREQNFEQLANTMRSIRDEAMNLPQETGSAAIKRDGALEVTDAIRDALYKASPEFEEVQRVYGESMSAIDALKADLPGRIARAEGMDLYGLSRMISEAPDTSVRQALTLLEAQSPGISRDLLAAEIKDSVGRLFSMSPEEIAGKPELIRQGIFPKSRNATFYTFLPDETQNSMRQFNKLLRRAAELKPKTERGLLSGAIPRPGVPQAQPSIVSSLLFLVSGARRTRSTLQYRGVQNQITALAEALADPAVAKSPQMQRFNALNFSRADEFREGVRILSQLTDEIYQGITPTELPEQQEAPQ